MGIESDQLVFDYLSRVGDLAQQRGLPSATRMRLVARLRSEIDAQKVDSVSGVKRLLSRLGTPEAVVTDAAGNGARGGGRDGGGSDGTAAPASPRPVDLPGPRPVDPAPRTGVRDKLGGLGRRSGPAGLVPEPRNGAGSGPSGRPGFLRKARAQEPDVPETAAPPHLAGMDEVGDEDDAPDWWRVEPAPFGPGESVPGFVGGIEIPEIWERPKGDGPSLTKDGEPESDGDADGEPEPDGDADATAGGRRGLAGTLRRALAGRRAVRGAGAEVDDGAAEEEEAVAEPARVRLSPVVTLAVLLLVAGAVLESWIALAAGWALVYASRRLSRGEAKFAAMGVPGIVAGGLLVWLWGRFDGRWGEPLAEGRLGQELLDGLPGMARVAAVASALFLVWRMRRWSRG
ncbi:hypothetical protein FCH28_17055 [Streptomyces piniterrae]|uniref:Uncharacterized protein n=1 Tax=Streptomyces piniterrae TaxID=2571125 RepID=A0A4U0NG26_9ACTN|nr:hypothetical protein [Streptomyces piniterrae]TJZ52883.1 hypothetical protein FCH28_17055 [Streptomyces piniterrae]